MNICQSYELPSAVHLGLLMFSTRILQDPHVM